MQIYPRRSRLSVKVLDRLRRDPCTMSKLGSDLDKSLEELEGTQWPAPTHDPRLVHGLFPSEKLTTPSCERQCVAPAYRS